MSALELTSAVVTPRAHSRPPMPIYRATFVSRKAEFSICTSEYDWIDSAIWLHVGPLGLNLRCDEARAAAAALLAAADHYETQLGRAP